MFIFFSRIFYFSSFFYRFFGIFLFPAVNLIRIPMSILVAYAAYKVSKNLIKVEEEEVDSYFFNT